MQSNITDTRRYEDIKNKYLELKEAVTPWSPKSVADFVFGAKVIEHASGKDFLDALDSNTNEVYRADDPLWLHSGFAVCVNGKCVEHHLVRLSRIREAVFGND